MAPIIKLTGKVIEALAERTSDEIIEYAEKNWRELIDEDGFMDINNAILSDTALEKVVDAMRITPDAYNTIFMHPLVKKALGAVPEIVKDAAQDTAASSRFWSGSLYEQLREIGMQINDFL